MVLADAKGVEPDLVRVLDLLDEVPQTVLRAHGQTAVVERGGEAVNADLHQGTLVRTMRNRALPAIMRACASAA